MPVSSSWSVPEASSHASPRGCYSCCCFILAHFGCFSASISAYPSTGRHQDFPCCMQQALGLPTKTFESVPTWPLSTPPPSSLGVRAHLRPCTRHEADPHNSQGENEGKQTNRRNSFPQRQRTGRWSDQNMISSLLQGCNLWHDFSPIAYLNWQAQH